MNPEAMSAAVAVFEEDTAYETYVLTVLSDADEMVRGRMLAARDDIRGGRISSVRHVADSLSAGDVRAAVQRFRPLIFGAAYKVLDLVVEMVAALNVSDHPGRWLFRDKVRFAREASEPAVMPAPLAEAPDLWPRYAALYVGLEPARHALVHRRVRMSTEGDLEFFDEEGRSLMIVSAAQTESLALAVYHLREALIQGDGRARRLNSFARHLDVLGDLHAFPEIGAKEQADDLRIVEDDLELVEGSRWRINRRKIADHLELVGGPPFADVVLQAGEYPEWRFYGARFEEMPAEDDIVFDEHWLPAWLHTVPPEQGARPELLTMLRWEEERRRTVDESSRPG